ncbi:MAG: 4-vinyl reductase [Sulfuricellaceae bacterium]
MSNIDPAERFKLNFDKSNYRRMISGKEVIVHCHHYNSRIQRTVEESRQIDGRRLVVSTAEAVFSEMCSHAFLPGDSPEKKWEIAASLYAHLGLGSLDVSRVGQGIVRADTSHFVEGWSAGLGTREAPVCNFTVGYLQGAYHAISGQNVSVTEKECLIHGVDHCVFEIDTTRTEPHCFNHKPYPPPASVAAPQDIQTLASPNVDQAKIIDALVEMPIYGDPDGLIPAFGVYLANMPADFYNLLFIQYVEEMQKVNLHAVAKKLLMADAETCALNTFRGIMNSAEWDRLIAPMVKEPQDNLYGILAVSNGLGWGNWQVVEHEPAKRLVLASLNGYEALGYREYRPRASSPQCFMLTGVAAGIMALVYGKELFKERFGAYKSTEERCICRDDPGCSFSVVSRK